MAIVAMTNQKGGVGKTTSTINLGAAFARRGLRVLLVDDDPQSSLSQGFLGRDQALNLPPERTIYALFASLPVAPEELVLDTGFAGLALLPGSRHAGSFNVPDPHRLDPETQATLGHALAPVAEQFDLVLIDTAPCLQFLTWAALHAADAVLIPAQAEQFGNQGITDVKDWLFLVEQARGRALPIAGLIVSQFKGRRSLQQVVVATLREMFPETLETTIPDAVEIPEAITSLKPIQWHKPRSAATRAVDALAVEVQERLTTLGLFPWQLEVA